MRSPAGVGHAVEEEEEEEEEESEPPMNDLSDGARPMCMFLDG